MGHYFQHFPKIKYDLNKDGHPRTIQNIFLRYRLLEALKAKTVLFHNHIVRDGQDATVIAHRYYNDPTLDWVIFITNVTIHPHFDWPLDPQPLINYIANKYGSIETALNTVHHYEWIIQQQTVTDTGTVIPAKTLIVDQTTYSTLSASERREIDCYTYEVQLNDSKREIKVLRKNHLDQFLKEAENLLK